MTYHNEGGNTISIQPENLGLILFLSYYQEEGRTRGWLRMDTDDYVVYLH